MSSTSAFPLSWPEGWDRTPASSRMRGWNFKQGSDRRQVTLDVARRKLYAELERMHARSVVLSSNVPLRADGQPRSDSSTPQDPGVALYFMRSDKLIAMACDRYDNPAANTRSLGLAIEAMRQLERHGSGTMLERAFTGFVSLPPPISHWEILGLGPGSSADAIKAVHRSLSQKAHPDKGGSTQRMSELNTARDRALAEIGETGNG